jgi:hypothetical protein
MRVKEVVKDVNELKRTELRNGTGVHPSETYSVSSDALICSCDHFCKFPGLLASGYQFAYPAPFDAFTAFCKYIDDTPIPPKELARLSCFLRALASEVGHTALLEELERRELRARARRVRLPDLIAESDRVRRSLMSGLEAAAENANERLSLMSRLEAAAENANERLEVCGLLRQLAGVDASPFKIGIVRELMALGRGNPHLTGLLAVDASSALANPPYVIADLDSLAVFSSGHDEPNQWVRYRFRGPAFVTGYQIWDPQWLRNWVFQGSESGDEPWETLHEQSEYGWPKPNRPWQIPPENFGKLPNGCRAVRIRRPAGTPQTGSNWVQEAETNALVLLRLEIFGYFINVL